MRKRLETIIIILVTALAIFFTHLYIVFYMPASQKAETRIIYVQRGEGFRVIAQNLESAGLIRDAESFQYAAKVIGAYKKVKAGEYELNTSMRPLEVLEYLIKGKVKRHFVTIPEGFNIREIAAALKAEGLTEEMDFIAMAMDARAARSFGVEGPTLEGYLFPDTYALTKGMTVDEIIAKMISRFKTVYSEVEGQARSRGMTMRKLVTLASIIEKETGLASERPMVSAVFHNRLKKGMKLQSDPTVIYDAGDYDGNIRKRHLLAKTPYNTYANFGLPPGPIANPGKASLAAALNPAREGFLYFVSRNDGSHYFSSSLKEHNRAVNQFQRVKAVTVKR